MVDTAPLRRSSPPFPSLWNLAHGKKKKRSRKPESRRKKPVIPRKGFSQSTSGSPAITITEMFRQQLPRPTPTLSPEAWLAKHARRGCRNWRSLADSGLAVDELQGSHFSETIQRWATCGRKATGPPFVPGGTGTIVRSCLCMERHRAASKGRLRRNRRDPLGDTGGAILFVPNTYELSPRWAQSSPFTSGEEAVRSSKRSS